MDKIRIVYKKLFSKYLFVTNTVTCGTLLALGDGIIQNIENIGLPDSQDSKDWKFDWNRTGRLFVVGLLAGPFNHGWYSLLDKVILGQGGKVVVKKILADQLVAAPYFCSFFFAASGALEGKSLEGIKEELSEKFLRVYLTDWCVWPPAQFVNFYFLPTQFRVAYVSFMTLCWNSFLSYIKHKDQHKPELQALTEETVR